MDDLKPLFEFIALVLVGPGLVLLMVIAMIASEIGKRACQACKERINKEAAICPHCRSAVPTVQAADAKWGA